MDYEKKYKDALVNIQELYNSMKYMSSTDALHTTTTLERAFPELKESEGEKIRKELIKGISKTRPNTPFLDTNITREEALVWLEKQGEQKFVWNEEDETALGDALWCCKQAASIAKNENDMGNIWYAENWLKSLKERLKGE